ncbi:helix-hairpin-helix domain-containing protein [candidate division WOR-3 bacterium]|nr:helix-hairpin-helix domain-containing protein [candidate division WOR-3 bacterium]
MIYLIILFLISGTEEIKRKDLNSVSLQELYSLPLDSSIAENIIEYRIEHGSFRTFTDLIYVKDMDPQSYSDILKEFSITPLAPADWRNLRIDQLKDRLASEDDPGNSAIDYWENLLLFPLDLNKATVQQLNSLYGVSLIDASAIVSHRQKWGDYRYLSHLRNTENLSSYGYRNIRYYVFEPDDSIEDRYWGIVRYKSELENLRNEEGDLNYYKNELEQRIGALEDIESSIYEDLTLSGWTPGMIDSLRMSLESDFQSISSIKEDFNASISAKGGYSDRFRAGAAYNTEEAGKNTFQGYVLFEHWGFVQKFIAGDYRLTLSEGLFMDNSSEFRARTTQRIRGLYPALTPNSQYGFRGAAAELNFMDIAYPLLFVSYSKRDAILSSDDTALALFSFPWEIEKYSENLTEKLAGAGISFRLDKYLPGTCVEAYFYALEYDKYFLPDTSLLDIPGDRDNLEDGNFLLSSTGQQRQAYSVSARTVFSGIFQMSGELAGQKNGKKAYLISSRVQKEFIYLDFIFRHYDIGYDNPFSRGFAEQRRFEDTEFEKPYRLLNPVYSYLQYDPVPKAEQGFYIETRYQITRSLTITKAYVDIWKNLATGLDNFRSQATVEYRFSYPMSFRLRQKWQNKKLQKPSYYSSSVTNETELTLRFFLQNSDYISFSLARSQVMLSQREGKGNSEIISGYYLSGRYEHKFYDGFSVLGGMDIWNGEEMSMWEFEDMGIDFLYGHGIKTYFAARQRLNDNIFLRFKVRHDLSYSPYYGSEELHFADGQLYNGAGFDDVSSNFYLYILMDYRF